MKLPSLIVLVAAILLLSAKAANEDLYSINCYQQSQQSAGVETEGSYQSDWAALNAHIADKTVTNTFQAAAVKTCTNNQTGSSDFGKLMGHQIALADYSNISGDTPTDEELVWLPGIGSTQNIEGAVTCPTIIFHYTIVLEEWHC